MLNKQGFISESSGSCIFFIKDNELFTPSEESDILIGITRGSIIRIAKNNNIRVNEANILLEEILHFDFAFLAGTMIEIKPISNIEKHFFQKENATYDFIVNEYLKYTLHGGV